jgi:hypothetical protein
VVCHASSCPDDTPHANRVNGRDSMVLHLKENQKLLDRLPASSGHKHCISGDKPNEDELTASERHWHCSFFSSLTLVAFKLRLLRKAQLCRTH